MKAFRLTSMAVGAAALLWLGCAPTIAEPDSDSAATPHAGKVSLSKAEADTKKTASTRSSTSKKTSGEPQIYLLRGLLNIFSLGMDDLAGKIQAMGLKATVYNHTEWESLSNEIIARYKAGDHGPIILIGHSLGADSVVYMADYLGKNGVPVALLVPFDGTRTLYASSNVARMMNITQRDYAYARKGAGFHGELQNVDVSGDENIGHISIDKSARLHALVLNKIATVVKRGDISSEFASVPTERKTPTPRPAPHGPQPIVSVSVHSMDAPAAAETPSDAKPVEANPVSTMFDTSAIKPATIARPASKPSTAEAAPAASHAAANAPAVVSAPAPAPVVVATPPAPPAAPKAPASATNALIEYQQLTPKSN